MWTWLAALTCYVLFIVYAGQSVPNDYYIYHDYAALQSTQNRLTQDLFPAGIQSYLNPLGFWPLAHLLRADAPSWLIATLLGSIHSLNALFLFLICNLLSADRPRVERWAIWIGGAIGCVTPALLSVLGTSFLDPLTSVPMMASLWLAIRPRGSKASYMAAAVLAGASVGLKLSNAPFGFAIAIVLVLNGPLQPRSLTTRAVAGAVAMWAGLLITHGWWSFRLWNRFGNPVFPLANELFRSPWASADKLVYARFTPEGWTDALSMPFQLALPKPWVYAETIIPDIVPAAVTALGLVALTAWLWRHRKAGLPRLVPPPDRLGPETCFWVYLVSAWILWLLSNGNGRYAIPVLLLGGTAFALLAVRLLSPRKAAALCAILLTLQIGNTHVASMVRWSAGQWVRHWTSFEVPVSLKSKPMLYISADGLVKSALARHVHPDSSFVQLVGSTYSVPASGITGHWLSRKYERYGEDIRAVFKTPVSDGESPAAFNRYAEMLSRTLNRAGLVIDATRCDRILINGQLPYGPNFNTDLRQTPEEQLWACVATRAEPLPGLAAKRASADRVFRSLEVHCPSLYRPANIQTEGDGRIWTRVYAMRDALIVTVNQVDGTVSQRLFGQSSNSIVGTLDTWERDIAHYDCSLPYGGVRGSGSLRHTNIRPAK